MKNTIRLNHMLYGALVAILFISIIGCVNEQVIPFSDQSTQDLQISLRTDGPVNIQLIKLKVANRDNIPIEQILSCFYYGETPEGYWEYHLITMYDGLKIYIVTQIIGDDFDGG